MKHSTLDTITMVLLIIGGLNWGIFGIWQVDLVDQIFTSFSHIVFVLIGLAALYQIGTWVKTNSK
jgi:uncharacterized membrane protein YuzA (DUF378 family)